LSRDSQARRILVAVGWPYANGSLHLGHIAGAYLPADIFARYHRMVGDEVLMVSGSDIHGTPITVRAEQESRTPQEIVDQFHPEFLGYWRDLGISFDLFTHTGTENHAEVTHDIFLRLMEHGYIYKGTTSQFYDPQAGRFLPDRYVEGTCPHCGYEKARGDQCENCGRTLDPEQLINPRSRMSGATPESRDTEHYFLKLSAFQQPLLEWLRSRHGWRKHVLNFSIGFVEEGLHDRAITRDLEWGISLPVEDLGPGKRIYVWFEAVIGYLSASKEWAKLTGDPEAWRRWWEEPDALGYYFIGKDNIPFHTIIWQAELLGIDGIYNEDHANHQNDDEHITLPYDVPANEFMNIEGKQFSKSRNWAIWLPDILERYQADAIRYYVAATFPETHDSDFAWDGFLNRVNGELLAAWGNLVNRMLSFAYKRFDGVVPDYPALTLEDVQIINKVEDGFSVVGALIEQVKLREALQTAMGLARDANAYLDSRKPWITIKEDPDDAARSVYTILRVIDNLKTILAPFVPFSAQQVHEYLGYSGQVFGDLKIEEYPESEKSHRALVYDGSAAIGKWEKSHLKPGQALREPKALYVKLEPEIVDLERGFLGQPRDEHAIEG
jgi:methionyl-tRNA synthetase